MTKDDKRWLEDVASLGCVVCRNLGYGATPAEVHH
ncbi:Ref family recombination enhancement nuclease, partial [Escherichia coli]